MTKWRPETHATSYNPLEQESPNLLNQVLVARSLLLDLDIPGARHVIGLDQRHLLEGARVDGVSDVQEREEDDGNVRRPD